MRRARGSRWWPTRSRSWRRRRRGRPRTSPGGCRPSRPTPAARWRRSGRSATVIAQINDYQLTIARAVEEQTATTKEMSRSVAEAAAGTDRDRREHHRGLHGGRSPPPRRWPQTRVAVDELSRMAADLRTTVARLHPLSRRSCPTPWSAPRPSASTWSGCPPAGTSPTSCSPAWAPTPDHLRRLAAAHPVATGPRRSVAGGSPARPAVRELAATGVPSRLRSAPARTRRPGPRPWSHCWSRARSGTPRRWSGCSGTTSSGRSPRAAVLVGARRRGAGRRRAGRRRRRRLGERPGRRPGPAVAPCAAVGRVARCPTPTSVPAGTAVRDLLDRLAALDGRVRGPLAGRRRRGTRRARRSWAAAMHDASWAAHVSGRTRALAAAQLLAVRRLPGRPASPPATAPAGCGTPSPAACRAWR